jgi:Siphovirus Gp157
MTTNFLAADVANLEAEIHDLFAAYPELEEDEQLRADMLEGSTAAFDVLTRLVALEREADSMSKARAARISDLQALKGRADRKKEAMRALMLRIMKAAGIKKAPLVEATVSVSKGRDSVEIVDEEALPDNVVKVVRTPDKGLIKEALALGPVDGARMKTGDDMLTVRAA